MTKPRTSSGKMLMACRERYKCPFFFIECIMYPPYAVYYNIKGFRNTSKNRLCYLSIQFILFSFLQEYPHTYGHKNKIKKKVQLNQNCCKINE